MTNILKKLLSFTIETGTFYTGKKFQMLLFVIAILFVYQVQPKDRMGYGEACFFQIWHYFYNTAQTKPYFEFDILLS